MKLAKNGQKVAKSGYFGHFSIFLSLRKVEIFGTFWGFGVLERSGEISGGEMEIWIWNLSDKYLEM